MGAPSEIYVNSSGTNWVSLSWYDSYWCKDTITAYSISFYKTPNLIMDGEQRENVPIECVNQTDGLTYFDSRNCPDFFEFEPCGKYDVSIQVQGWQNQTSPMSERKEFTTKQRK